MKRIIVILSAWVLLLPGCGKKGPLVLEPQKLPPAVEGLGLRQIGRQVELSWRFPLRLSDQKTPLQAAQVRSVTVYHLAKPFSPETFLKKSEVLAKLKATELINRGNGAFACVLPFKDKLLKDKEHAFAVAYHYGRTGSAPSAVERLATRMPPEPVRDLKIEREGKVVVLGWSRPQADSEGKRLPAVAGYKVYRRILQGKAPGEYIAISGKPVKGEYYEDGDTGVDGEYEYQVSTLLSERIESAPSNPVKMRIEDIFPPDVPAGLVTFTAKDHVFLTWEAVPDRDLDHYVVYRKSAKDADFKILAAAVSDNFFHDRQVGKGQLYAYMVSAVDRKGNESEPCRAVRQLFE